MATSVIAPQGDSRHHQVFRDALAEARKALGVDVVYYTELLGQTLMVRGVDGDGEPFGFVEGAKIDYPGSFCRRVVEGELPNAMGDVKASPEAMRTPAAKLGMGAYMSVAVRHADGRLYGTLCAVSHAAHPELDARDARLLEVLAGVLARQLEHEHQYHQVLETAREPVWITDLAGNTVFVNQPTADLLRMERADFVGTTAFDFLSPSQRAIARSALASRADGNLERYEIELTRADGTVVFVEVSGAPLTDASGAVIGSVAMLTDLTVRKEAERLSEARFRWLADLIDDQVWISDPDGRLDFVNDRIRDYYGSDATLAHTTDWRAFVHPDDVDAPRAARISQAEGQAYEFTVRLRRHDGEYREHIARAFPMHDDRGRVMRWYGITIDLTDSRAQVHLRESEARLREAQQIARIGAFRIGPDLELDPSDEFLAIYGLGPDEFTGLASIVERIHPDDRDAVPAFTRDQPATTYEHRVVLELDEVRVLQVRVSGAAGTIQDITEQRAAETAETARVEAERANAAKSQFLSRMSHELRTPLNAILGFGQLLELDPLTDDQRESVGHILRAGAHLLELINEVLEISRIEAGALRLSLETVEVKAVVSEVADLLAPLAAERQVSTLLDFGDAEECYVRADLQRVKQILLNLLSNAIKYNRVGGQVTVRVRPHTDGCIRIVVSDTGEGLLPEEVTQLFSPFERLGASSGSTEGTGLGLALSRALAEVMHADLSATSRVGVGTDLTLILNGAQAPVVAPQAAVDRLDESLDERPGAPRTRVLYVEDNPSNLRLVERVLTRAGHHVIEAPQGRLGLELARQHHPDLILLDLDLPDVSGEEVLERLGEDPATAHIPVIICSADANRSTIERLEAAGARGFVTKPIDVKELLKTIAAMTDVESKR